MEVVKATKPFFGAPEMPEAPSPDAVRRMQAKIGAFGGAEVKATLWQWVECRNDFFNEARKLDDMQRDPSDPSEIEGRWGLTLSSQWQQMDATRKRLDVQVRELEDAVNAEIRS